ncbi:MAG: SlyX family protein [Bdellovibrionota bacterium]
MSDTNEQRITELEIKIAHQEVLIEDLRSALVGHHDRLEKVEKLMKFLKDRGEGSQGPAPTNEKPPHY